jgi:hypothetical protein
VKFEIEKITPDEARALIDRTASLGFNNRSIQRSRVEKLAHAIVTGQWQVTHQGIAIGADGGVLDGQHRLHAIVMADQAIETLIARETDPDTFTVLDTGAARTTADTLRIAGFSNPNNVSAMVRGFLAYQQVVGTTDSFERALRLITTTDVVDFLDDSKKQDSVLGALQGARSVAASLARYGLTSSLGITMMVCRLRTNELGAETTAEFFARLSDGAMLAPSSPILALRRWYMSDTGYARVIGQHRRSVAIACTIKALNDYALRRDRLVVQFKWGVEPYPAPLPRGSRRRLERELEEKEAAQGA